MAVYDSSVDMQNPNQPQSMLLHEHGWMRCSIARRTGVFMVSRCGLCSKVDEVYSAGIVPRDSPLISGNDSPTLLISTLSGIHRKVHLLSHLASTTRSFWMR